MKVVHIYGQIINCEEIRNVTLIGKTVCVYFKNSTASTIIEGQDSRDAKDIMDLIFSEMIAGV